MDTEHNTGTPGRAYETRDANLRSLLRFGFGLFVTLVLAWAASKWIFDYFGRVQQLGPPATPFEQGRALPPLPQLQVRPVQDLEQLREKEGGSLDSYGWVDRGRGIVHIPIDRAMDLLLERGLPTRPGAAAGPDHGQASPKATMPAAHGKQTGGS
jgi:hypothetical protein